LLLRSRLGLDKHTNGVSHHKKHLCMVCHSLVVLDTRAQEDTSASLLGRPIFIKAKVVGGHHCQNLSAQLQYVHRTQ
jgi:hypothetical protein